MPFTFACDNNKDVIRRNRDVGAAEELREGGDNDQSLQIDETTPLTY